MLPSVSDGHVTGPETNLSDTMHPFKVDPGLETLEIVHSGIINIFGLIKIKITQIMTSDKL